MKHPKISPWMAALLSANVMVGAGVFVNLSTLTKLAGPWGFLGYVLGAIVLLPVIISLATLTSMHAVAGGLLVYGKEYLHPVAGFLSSWSYFLGKSVSVALFADVLISSLHSSFGFMQYAPVLVWSIGFLIAIALLHIAGLHFGGWIQWVFTTVKLIPIVSVVASAVMRGGWVSGGLFAVSGPQEIAYLVPISIFALSGFEVICTIGHMIENPKKNALRIAVGSSLAVAFAYAVLQFSSFVIAGSGLVGPDYMSTLGSKLVPPFSIFGFMINDFMYASFFSASFNILTNNSWNLFALAKNRFFPAESLLTRCTAGGVPWVALFMGVALSSTILAITSDFIALQNMSVLGAVVAYLISTLAALVAFYRTKVTSWLIPFFGLISCSYVLNLCIKRLIVSGLSFSFLTLFSLGVIAAVVRFVLEKMRVATF